MTPDTQRRDSPAQIRNPSSFAVERYWELVEHGMENPPESPFSKALSQAVLGGEEFKKKMKDPLKTKRVRAARRVEAEIARNG